MTTISYNSIGEIELPIYSGHQNAVKTKLSLGIPLNERDFEALKEDIDNKFGSSEKTYDSVLRFLSKKYGISNLTDQLKAISLGDGIY